MHACDNSIAFPDCDSHPHNHDCQSNCCSCIKHDDGHRCHRHDSCRPFHVGEETSTPLALVQDGALHWKMSDATFGAAHWKLHEATFGYTFTKGNRHLEFRVDLVTEDVSADT